MRTSPSDPTELITKRLLAVDPVTGEEISDYELELTDELIQSVLDETSTTDSIAQVRARVFQALLEQHARSDLFFLELQRRFPNTDLPSGKQALTKAVKGRVNIICGKSETDRFNPEHNDFVFHIEDFFHSERT